MDRAPDTVETLRERHGERYKWLVLFTVMIGTMASFVSSTIVNVAVPTLSAHFAIGQERAQWIGAAFMVAMISSLSATPWLLQRFGLRRTYAAATLLLMLGGLAGGLSGDFTLLVAMRAVEGIAGGILQPLPSIVIMRAFPMNEQGRAMGIFGLGVVLAPAMGPTVGGILIEHLGWRSIFFVVIPFCLVALALTRKYLPLLSSMVEEKRPLDWLGLAWISASTILVLNGLAGLRASTHAGPAILIALGGAGLVSFVFYQLKKKDALLQVRLFAHRPLLAGSIAAFVFGFGIFGSTYLLPVFLQMALHYSPTEAGTTLLPGGLALALSMPIAGRLADALPSRRLVVAGALIVAASLVPLGIAPAGMHYAVIVAWIVLGRIGLAIMHPALSLGCIRGLPAKDLPQAMSMNNFARQFGGAMGIGVTGILLDWRLSVHAHEAAGVMSAFGENLLMLAAVSALAAAAAWFMKEK